MIELFDKESTTRIPLNPLRYHRVVSFAETTSLIESWTRVYRFWRSSQN